MVDKELIVFHSNVIEVVEKEFNASCSGRDAELFVDRLFDAYKKAGRPRDVKGWLASFLTGEFLSVAEPPRWVEEERSWPFFDGMPMVFIQRITLPRNTVTESHLTWDVELYLFGIRLELDRGYRVEYKVVTQIAGINGEDSR